jgi:hypothetical protein
MVFGKFYPRYTELSRTDEYLIYDFTKSPAQNRPEGSLRDSTNVGTAIFPPGQKNVSGDNIGVPENQLHTRGSQFYWASDSRAIMFADQLNNAANSMVFVVLNDRGEPSAFQHQVTITDMCGREIADVKLNWTMDRPRMGTDLGNGRPISAEVGSSDARCPAHVLQLNSKVDFRPSATEVHLVQTPTRGMIKDGVVIRAPQQK